MTLFARCKDPIHLVFLLQTNALNLRWESVCQLLAIMSNEVAVLEVEVKEYKLQVSSLFVLYRDITLTDIFT